MQATDRMGQSGSLRGSALQDVMWRRGMEGKNRRRSPSKKDASPMSNPRISVSQLKQLIQLRSNDLRARKPRVLLRRAARGPRAGVARPEPRLLAKTGL